MRPIGSVARYFFSPDCHHPLYKLLYLSRLSAEDIDILIETAPHSDEEWQRGEKRERDYRDGPDYRWRRGTHVPYTPVRPPSRGFRDSERRYRGRYREHYAYHRDYSAQYGEVNFYDDRYAS